jgi:hypothetical protein
MVRAMTYRARGALIASLSAVTLLLASHEASARSGVAVAAPPAAAHAHPTIAPSARFFHGRRNSFLYWPGGGGFDYAPPSTEPFAGMTQPLSSEVRYTYTYDVPWDWIHRFPPNVTPSDRPYVPSCPSETVTVPGRSGAEQTVNIIRCY